MCVVPEGELSRSLHLNSRIETFLILALGLIYIPLLINKNLYWDDWAWLWAFWVQGPAMLLKYYVQVSHMGWWLPMATFYRLGGEYAGVLARIVTISSLLASALLLHRIFFKIELTRTISVWIAALYVLSPFYHFRGVMVASVIDLFLFTYLLSIWVMSSTSWKATVPALILFCLSLGYETVVMLEPLRILFVNEFHKDLKKTVRQCAPVWTLGLVFVILRFTLLKPYGCYNGYNSLNLHVSSIGKCFVMSVLYYPRAIWLNITQSADLVTWHGLAVLTALCLVLARVLTYRNPAGLIAGPAGFNLTLRRVMFGTAITVLGAVPYILAGLYPAPHNFSCRFAVVSIPGALLVFVSLIAAFRSSFLRTYAYLLFVTVSILFSLQITKWYLYEGAVKRDLIMQIHEMTSAGFVEQTKIFVKIIPDSTNILILGKRISVCELTVPVNLLRDPKRPLVFLQEKGKAADQEWTGPCTIDQNDRYPCPGKPVTLEYRLRPEYASVNKTSYLYLLKSIFETFDEPPRLGLLTDPSGSLSAGQAGRSVRTRVSLRTGGRIAAGILSISMRFLQHPAYSMETLRQIRN
ncbi:MAG: hypothetical protein WBG50_04135 [Desulfomonilaceae bacterium]